MTSELRFLGTKNSLSSTHQKAESKTSKLITENTDNESWSKAYENKILSDVKEGYSAVEQSFGRKKQKGTRKNWSPSTFWEHKIISISAMN